MAIFRRLNIRIIIIKYQFCKKFVDVNPKYVISKPRKIFKVEPLKQLKIIFQPRIINKGKKYILKGVLSVTRIRLKSARTK